MRVLGHTHRNGGTRLRDRASSLRLRSGSRAPKRWNEVDSCWHGLLCPYSFSG
eukprot:COSAG02_NODE_108_length_36286_cov_19.437478_9_plen_53_part_00